MYVEVQQMNMQHIVMMFIVQYAAVVILAMTSTFGFGLLVTGRALVKMMRQDYQ
jgi:hypothetical protein